MSFTRKSPFTYVGLEEYDELEPLYCPYCTKVYIYEKLQPRVYPEGELPSDAEDWLQCYRCGKTIHIEQGQEQGEYVPIVDIVENQYEIGSQFIAPEPRNKQKKRNKLTKTQMSKILQRETSGEQGIVTIHTDTTKD